jgi:hypothetical protein
MLDTLPPAQPYLRNCGLRMGNCGWGAETFCLLLFAFFSFDNAQDRPLTFFPVLDPRHKGLKKGSLPNPRLTSHEHYPSVTVSSLV